MTPAWVAYYRELVAYAWRVHVACRGEVVPAHRNVKPENMPHGGRR